MGVTVYSHTKYQTGNDKYNIDDKYMGTFEGMPCFPTWNDCPSGGWGNKVGSLKIDPEGAYEWCGWDKKLQGGEGPHCYYNNTPEVRKDDFYESRSVKKMCSHNIHKWDCISFQKIKNTIHEIIWMR